MDQKQLEVDFKKKGAVDDNMNVKGSNASIELLQEDLMGSSTHENLKQLELIGDYQLTCGSYSHIAKRSSIINQAEVFTQRQVMREALKMAVVDDKQGGFNDQIWYDSLRETDDGRFSQTNVFTH